MSLNIAVYSGADTDIVDQLDYLGRDDVDLALRFLAKVEATFLRLAASPEPGEQVDVRNPRLAGLRVWQVSEFPNHLIYYRPSSETLEVIRVLHAARDTRRILEEET